MTSLLIGKWMTIVCILVTMNGIIDILLVTAISVVDVVDDQEGEVEGIKMRFMLMK